MRLLLIPLVLIAAATVVYPFIVYSSLDHWGAANLAWLLFALLAVRVFIRRDFRQPEQYLQLILVGGLCVLAALFNSERLLRYYPVAMSLAFAGFFWVSLSTDKPLIERFASLTPGAASKFSEQQRNYMRSLTKVWGALLVVNAAIASYTACCTTLKIWTLYNGALAYVLLGLFSVGELIFRHFYRLRHAESG